MRQATLPPKLLLVASCVLPLSSAYAQSEAPPEAAAAAAEPPPPLPAPAEAAPGRYTLIEDFTADTLAAGEFKIGADAQFGLTGRVMIGTDAIATVLGAPTLGLKVDVWDHGAHRVALGLRGAYLSRNTALWGDLKEQFRALDARIVRPSVSWTRTLSPRLKLHTFFAKGLGKVHAVLSNEGQRQLWQAKHPGSDYDHRDPATNAPAGASGHDTSTNQAHSTSQRSALAQKTIQVQSIAGLAQERFQLTGEFSRSSGNKVLVTCDIEETRIEALKSNFFRLTVSHQWIWTNFQMRIGFGPQYYVVGGTDLDGEVINQSGWTPASDISFYWRF
ncbi:MAG: hypothetical protein NTZ90_14190 [Proteobacteria bacterium]|nr:hypothetical protein [Pseudomonadota bacterium]